MIVRKFQWILLLSLHLLPSITAQDSRSYDTNDWIPVTPTSQANEPKKAQGRVLTLDTPNQNFFPENEFARKKPQPQQYLRETAFQKEANVRNQPKVEQPYKFEPVVPLQPPQYVQQTHFIPPPQLQQAQYVQTLPQQIPIVQRPNQELVAPSQNGQNFYNTGKGQQYDLPFNNSFYQSLTPGALNQELIGAIKNNPNVNKIELTSTTTKPKEEKESVQLLYVPLENLKQNYPSLTQQQVKTIVSKPIESVRGEKNMQNFQNHRQIQLENIEDDFIRQALAAHKLQQQFQLGQPIQLHTTTTTEKPKKRKPHQPPLAVYMEKQGSADVKDVLEVLKRAKTISVQDNIGPNSPQVFVGPSNLKTAEGYVKFPLPYLSNVQGNRIERKVEQLPFFVAPLSYKTPDGYSKIPLPSPHVGSVVVSNKEELHEKHPEPVRQPQTAQNQIVQDFDVKQPFPQYRQEVKPDYLINQNSPQQSSGGLLGLGNDFLASFRGNAPQDYEATSPRNVLANYQINDKGNVAEDYQDTPTKEEYVPNIAQNYQRPPSKQLIAQNYEQTPNKDFITNLQLGLKDNNQFYQSTPTYQNQPKTNIRNNYQIPNYQTNLKEAPPTQTSKEVIRDYDIPSVPVESKNSFIPSFQLEAKPQVNQFPSSIGSNFATPKNQPTVYAISEEPIRQTTTTENNPVVQNQYKLIQNAEPQYTVPSYNTRNQDPFRQVINQYEIEQINSQLGEGKNENVEQIRTTTPVLVATQKYEDYDVPTTVRSRSRSRHRGRVTTTSTTPNAISDDKYTVLEEFAVQPKTTTAKYTTEVETIPANVYKLNTDRLEPVFIQNQQPTKQRVLNQDALDQQVLHVNQPIRDGQYLLTRPNQEPQRLPVQDSNPPLIYNRGQNPQQQDIPQDNPYLPGFINNLQDQAVRPLLIPNLLVPTTEKLSTTIKPTTEEIREIVTTEAPRIETTTQRRGRGRVRANSSRQSTSAPRRSNRRRPAHTRPTTERQLRTTTEAASTYEPTKRTSNHRQRFRTRGRPLAKETPATERVERVERVLQTTENAFKQPPLEGGFQVSSGNPAPQSYYQFDHIIENQQVITVKPEPVSEEKQPFKEYHMVYSLPAQTNPPLEQIPETTSTTSRQVIDVQITHAAPVEIKEAVTAQQLQEEPQFVSRVNGNIQSGGVIHNTPHDATTRASVRVRGRTRSRGRFSSTTPRPASIITTTTTTTEKPKEEEGEFYGFIRSPNFEKPSLLVHTTQQPVQLYSSSYQDPPRTLIQLEEEEANPRQRQEYESGSSAPVHFVGEIRPKYTTTEAPEPSTDAPRFRTRARIRIPNRKSTPQPAYNEVKSQKLDDQVTRRSSNVVRARGRGKSHYKLPDHMTTKPDDHDVEGGNYPSVYKSKELTTEKPSGFQITVDPYEEVAEGSDQEPHYSLYSPTILKNANEEWVEASILPSPNDLRIEDKQMYVDSSEELTTVADDQSEDEVATTVKSEETTVNDEKTTKKKKKGVWKLIRHTPVDAFETAESQNYHSVLNSFDEIAKVKPSPTTTTSTSTSTTTTERSLFDTLYSMLGLASKASTYDNPTVVKINKATITIPRNEEITTTTPPPTFPDEYTEETTTQQIQSDYDQDKEEQEETTTILPTTSSTTTTTESVVKNYDVEPWDMKEIRTSTSTEVSHETEICFKGKCVKSKKDETNS